MNAADARNLALALPEAIEKSHFGKPDFRVRNRIFMTLPPGGHIVVKLTPEQQDMLTGAEPEIFLPVPGAWGRRGWTRLLLEKTDEATLESAITTAWRNVAPASLQRKLNPSRSEPWSS
jgi:hypothetical protein